MAEYLRSHGVPAERIIIEPYSRTTEENILHLRAILNHPDYPEAFAGKDPADAPDPRAGSTEPDPPLPVVIVTSRTHLPRTLLMARALGLRPIGIGSPQDPKKIPTAIIREIGAMMIWGARALRRFITPGGSLPSPHPRASSHRTAR